jgi:hypothetical protein
VIRALGDGIGVGSGIVPGFKILVLHEVERLYCNCSVACCKGHLHEGEREQKHCTRSPCSRSLFISLDDSCSLIVQ